MTSANKLTTVTLAQVLKHLTLRKVIYLSGGYIELQALLIYRFTRRRFSPIRHLSSPPNVSFIFGNRKQITSAPFGVLHEQWIKKYGHTFVFNDVLGSLRLFAADLKALSFIMTQSSSFVRPELVRQHFVNNMGPGLLGGKAALVDELKTGSTAQRRDLLILCIKSNMMAEDEEHRISDEEVLAQIATFLVAGRETTATSTTWALYALAKNKDSQQKPRRELLDSGLGDEQGMAELDKLPYLDAVVRETMRIHPAVTGSVCQASQDELIPVSESFKDRYGGEQTHIRCALSLCSTS